MVALNHTAFFELEIDRELGDDTRLEDVLASMCDEEQQAEALRVLAWHLPKAYAVAWGKECICGGIAAVDAEGLRLVDAWLGSHTEASRAAAAQFAESNDYRSPMAWLNAAVGWTGGSLAPEDVEAVPPPPQMVALAVGSAIAVSLIDDEVLETRARACIDRGLEYLEV